MINRPHVARVGTPVPANCNAAPELGAFYVEAALRYGRVRGPRRDRPFRGARLTINVPAK